MSLYNYEGWSVPYLLNRPLSDEERRRVHSVDQKSFVEPSPQWTTIQLNNIFLEAIDKYYAHRGITALFLAPLSLLFVVVGFVTTLGIFLDLEEIQRQEKLLAATAAATFAAAMCSGFSYFMLKTLAAKEIGAYTHYPIRLNRKNRMVYVFRHNGPGGVLAVKWNAVLWEIAHCKRSDASQHEIRGHVKDPDGVTVRDTFPLGVSDSLDVVQGQWEHFRRYMEGGAGQVKPQQLLPLANRREPFWFGMRRCAANLDLHPIVVLVTSPLWASIGWVRWLIMRTCRVPRWPADVIEACEGQVRPGELMRKKDSISSSFGAANVDWLSRVVMVVGAFAGGACGAAFWYWVFTASGFTKTVGELFEMVAKIVG